MLFVIYIHNTCKECVSLSSIVSSHDSRLLFCKSHRQVSYRKLPIKIGQAVYSILFMNSPKILQYCALLLQHNCSVLVTSRSPAVCHYTVISFEGYVYIVTQMYITAAKLKESMFYEKIKPLIYSH